MAQCEWEYVTIEPCREGVGFDVFGHGHYPAWSVLAGQSRRMFLDCFETLEAARATYPAAESLDHSTQSTEPAMPSCDPDPELTASAGEHWGEDDY
jgi:hypothetical protein